MSLCWAVVCDSVSQAYWTGETTAMGVRMGGRGLDYGVAGGRTMGWQDSEGAGGSFSKTVPYCISALTFICTIQPLTLLNHDRLLQTFATLIFFISPQLRRQN